jgi:predicted nuclease with TOPRIM domain
MSPDPVVVAVTQPEPEPAATGSDVVNAAVAAAVAEVHAEAAQEVAEETAEAVESIEGTLEWLVREFHSLMDRVYTLENRTETTELVAEIASEMAAEALSETTEQLILEPSEVVEPEVMILPEEPSANILAAEVESPPRRATTKLVLR